MVYGELSGVRRLERSWFVGRLEDVPSLLLRSQVYGGGEVMGPIWRAN